MFRLIIEDKITQICQKKANFDVKIEEPMLSRQPYTLDRVVRLIITVVILAGIVYLVNLLRSVLLPFGVACLIAYILEPFVQFNRRLLNLKGRIIAVFVTLFETIFFISVLLYFFVPMIIDETDKLSGLIENYSKAKVLIPFLPDSIHHFLRSRINLHELTSLFTQEQWMSMIEDALSVGWSFITGSIAVLIGIVSWCIVIIYVIFIMLDYDKLGRAFRRMVPPKYRSICFKIGDDIKSSMNHYFRGQALVALCVGILFAIGFVIVGLPMAIVMGFFIFILTMVPYLQLISLPFVAFLCLVCTVSDGTSFWQMFGDCFAVYCIVQVINDLFLTPKILGKAMGLNPAILLLSLSIWGSLMGLFGLIVALPLTTLLIAYYDEYIINDRHEPPSQRNLDHDAIQAVTTTED